MQVHSNEPEDQQRVDPAGAGRNSTPRPEPGSEVGEPPVALPGAKLLKSLTNGYCMGKIHLCRNPKASDRYPDMDHGICRVSFLYPTYEC
ncbi:MAG: hypothetical protein WC799_23215 [Desulfobacteraceae bacterium]